MRYDVITLFPDLIKQATSVSIIRRAQEKGAVQIVTHDLRAFSFDKYGSVDDTPYGGGAGMVLRVDVMHHAIQTVLGQPDVQAVPAEKRRVVLMTPQGKRWNQSSARRVATDYEQVTLICGHYEGFDERIRHYVDEEVSIGDFVLTGGELAALVCIDSTARLLPEVLHEESPEEESFSLKDKTGKPLLEYPHYTRPFEYDGTAVPDILLSGNHAAIRDWRYKQAEERTEDRRKNS